MFVITNDVCYEEIFVLQWATGQRLTGFTRQKKLLTFDEARQYKEAMYERVPSGGA